MARRRETWSVARHSPRISLVSTRVHWGHSRELLQLLRPTREAARGSTKLFALWSFLPNDSAAPLNRAASQGHSDSEGEAAFASLCRLSCTVRGEPEGLSPRLEFAPPFGFHE